MTIPRLLSAGIVGFWLVMTGLLVQKIWFPAESRLAEVDPRAVFDLFVSRDRETQLEIFRDREVIGTLRAVPVPRSGMRPPYYHRFLLDGRVKFSSGGLFDEAGLFLKGSLSLSQEGEVPELNLTLSLSRPEFSLEVSKKAGDAAPAVRLKRGDIELLNTEGQANPLASMLLPMVGLSAEDLERAGRAARAEAEETEIKARHGRFTVRGQSWNGYIVTREKNGRAVEPGFKLYLTDTGEILQVDTPAGLTLVSRDLVPEEMRSQDF